MRPHGVTEQTSSRSSAVVVTSVDSWLIRADNNSHVVFDRLLLPTKGNCKPRLLTVRRRPFFLNDCLAKLIKFDGYFRKWCDCGPVAKGSWTCGTWVIEFKDYVGHLSVPEAKD